MKPLMIPAVILKSEITPIHQLVGKTNLEMFSIAGSRREPGSLTFLGFAGARRADGLYEGVFWFDAREGKATGERVSFIPLTGKEPR